MLSTLDSICELETARLGRRPSRLYAFLSILASGGLILLRLPR
jgi:hypothetical protein